MGDYLTTPCKEKKSEDGEYTRFKFGCCGMQGWRKNMEDEHVCIANLAEDVAFFGIFDGHGGQQVASFARKHMPTLVRTSAAFKTKNYSQALIEGFMGVDKWLESPEGRKEIEAISKANPMKGASCVDESLDPSKIADSVGCTACVAIITKTEIYVANAGDSRCVLSKKGIAINLSKDHKPDLPEEKTRIEKAGAEVEMGRVNGTLNLSRCLGDLEFKQNKKLKPKSQAISAFPDIQLERISNDTDFIILACDGIWDCLSSQEAVDFINKELIARKFNPYKPFKLSSVIESMFENIIATDTKTGGGIGCDNMSCIVVYLVKPK